MVDDPLPITVETTTAIFREREDELTVFVRAHREGIGYFKTHRGDALRVLTGQFHHPEGRAEKIFRDYVACMDETMQVEFEQFAKLLAQVSNDRTVNPREIARDWIVPGGLKQ